jgi:hypothetical protein
MPSWRHSSTAFKTTANPTGKAKSKGIGGKLVAAQGIGTTTLTDSSGNQYTLGDALYVPQAANLVAPQTQASRFGL